MWLVKVSGQAKGKGILTTDSVEEIEREVGRYLRDGVERIEIERVKLWDADR